MAGREREAIPHLEAVLKAQPNLMPALVALAQARLALNEPKLAIAPLEKVVAADPKNRDARGMLAAALLDAGRFDQAAAQLSRSRQRRPERRARLVRARHELSGAGGERVRPAAEGRPDFAVRRRRWWPTRASRSANIAAHSSSTARR